MKSVSFLGVVLVNHLFQQLILIILVLQHSLPQNVLGKILGSKAASKKPRKSMSHKATSEKTPNKFAILSHVKPSDFKFVTWFMLFVKFDLPQLQSEVSQTKGDLFWAFPVSSKRNIKTLNSCFLGKICMKPCAKLCFRKRSQH